MFMLSGCVALRRSFRKRFPVRKRKIRLQKRVKYGRNDDVPDGASFIRQGRISRLRRHLAQQVLLYH
ncbi:hypothetical protein FDC67_21250 [Salmonella enterica subsp. enterica serovar Stanley]|nr:hypothetical protein [Salmonella enterica]ECD5270149.1 hypothetical protein [Salmonella enterica subsp. enterica serovar Stanley]ECD7098230.1 hypothetical protein [Salmonella enterica subsp. enterica serovar Stanley]ECD7543761.1 hypothetical protein [Salmonella enterica subsp. enterica serovar Stanley]ECF1388443.1 hypothetical protein [Salmonella enterica subsp. enterica serovar Stanley]